MSNALAIATVTAALRRVLQDAVNADVAGAKVTTLRPDSLTNANPPAGVNIFLYQVSPNPALRNTDLPGRSANGTTVHRPRAYLDLHYLISFYGSEAELERTYGTRLDKQPHKYEAEGHVLTYRSSDGAFGLRFETSHGMLTAIQSGPWEHLNYVEGCG